MCRRPYQKPAAPGAVMRKCCKKSWYPGTRSLYPGAKPWPHEAQPDRKDTQFMNKHVAIETHGRTEEGATYRVHDMSLADGGRKEIASSQTGRTPTPSTSTFPPSPTFARKSAPPTASMT